MIEFRLASEAMTTKFPFSYAFGVADSRYKCVSSAIKLYRNLIKTQVEPGVLQLNTLCSIARQCDRLDGNTLRRLLRFFRAEDGLELNDFVSRVDDCYKRYVILQLNMQNIAKINKSVVALANAGFCIVVIFAVAVVFVDLLIVFGTSCGAHNRITNCIADTSSHPSYSRIRFGNSRTQLHAWTCNKRVL
jgi:hypothetical protein